MLALTGRSTLIGLPLTLRCALLALAGRSTLIGLTLTLRCALLALTGRSTLIGLPLTLRRALLALTGRSSLIGLPLPLPLPLRCGRHPGLGSIRAQLLTQITDLVLKPFNDRIETGLQLIEPIAQLLIFGSQALKGGRSVPPGPLCIVHTAARVRRRAVLLRRRITTSTGVRRCRLFSRRCLHLGVLRKLVHLLLKLHDLRR